jgi:transposase
MSRPYHIDLRSRAISMLNSGASIASICEILELSRSTIYLWRRTWQEECRIEAKTGYQKGHSHKIIDKEKFEAFILANPTKTQKELGELWEFPCSDATINKGLKSIGYTYKKRI